MLSPTTLAIPLYFILMGMEIVYNHFSKKKLYRLNDSIANLNAGASQQVVGVLMKILGIGAYAYIYQKFSFQWVDNTEFSWGNFIILFILWDLCYYWGHRLSHEINLFWSAHVVHHQSEEYNLSVALRQSWFQGIWTAPVYIPLALIGFSPESVVFVAGINLIYQFWIHTEVVNHMGPLEWIMNTPSHHRVHHGRNPKYIDKNHAGVFIIWDRLFGTFQKEEEKPVYGITTPVNSWNPIWANFAHFKTIKEQLSEATSFKDKLKVLFYKPGWSAKISAYLAVPEVDDQTVKKYDTQVSNKASWYGVIQYILATIGVAIFLFNFDQLNDINRLIVGGLIILSVWVLSDVFEQKERAFWLELIRWPLIMGYLDYTFLTETTYRPVILITLALVAIVSMSWVFIIQQKDKTLRVTKVTANHV